MSAIVARQVVFRTRVTNLAAFLGFVNWFAKIRVAEIQCFVHSRSIVPANGGDGGTRPDPWRAASISARRARS